MNELIGILGGASLGYLISQLDWPIALAIFSVWGAGSWLRHRYGPLDY